MSGIPPVVPKTLRNRVNFLQDQLKILVHNYQVLSLRLQDDPEDESSKSQIFRVKEYIIKFNEEQCFLFEKIRSFLKDLESGKFFKKQTLNGTAAYKPADSDDETCSDQINLNGDSECRRRFNRGSVGSNSSVEECEDLYVGYFCKEDFYKGHVESYRVDCPAPLEKVDDFLVSPTKKFRMREEINIIENLDKNKHMLNIDLMPSEVYADFMQTLKNQRKKLKNREFLSVPEVSDKKYRNQSFLMKMAVSPPQLRKRKPEGGIHKPSRPVRAITFPPERMGTRKQNSMKRRHETEEQKEIEKLRKLQPDVEK